MLDEARDTGDKAHSSGGGAKHMASDECDQLSELHGAELQSKSPAILSPALTDSSGGGGSGGCGRTAPASASGSGSATATATAGTLDRHEAYAVTKAAVEAAERQAEAIMEQKEAEGSATEEAEGPAAESEESPAAVSKTISLKQLYGMLCWLQVGNNRAVWLADPLEGCRRATTRCPHLADASAEMLNAVMDELNARRQRMIERHGSADDVPRDARMFEGGPLFVIFNHAVAGRLAEVGAALRANATGAEQQPPPQPQQQQQSPVRSGIRSLMDSPAFGGPTTPAAAGGPARHKRTMLPAEHPFMQRARRLTPAEVRQMRDELAVRREIGIRDAVLLADWVALRRRELELKERQLREIAREAQRDTSVEAIARLDEFVRRMHEAM